MTERGPLYGHRVAVTRARAQSASLVEKLTALGAEVVVAPAIRTRTIPGPPPELERFDLVCFTSANGVDALFERLHAAGLDARAFDAHGRVAAIGESTAAALVAHGIHADVIPKRAVAESLVEALAATPVTRALIPRAAQAREVLPDALRARGAEVEVLAVYETVPETLSAECLRAAAACTLIMFTSASTVRNFLAAAGGLDEWRAACQAAARGGDARPRTVSIGPVTSAELRAQQLGVDIEAERHDVDGMITATLGDERARSLHLAAD